jgi:hypothetical protein
MRREATTDDGSSDGAPSTARRQAASERVDWQPLGWSRSETVFGLCQSSQVSRSAAARCASPVNATGHGVGFVR